MTRDSNRAGNQVVFRGRNEKVNRNIAEYNQTAKGEGQVPVETGGNESLMFYCECSDEKCLDRIKVTFSDYEKNHIERDEFIVKPHHVVEDIEEVIDKGADYWTVKKYDFPEQKITKLKKSGLNHSNS